MNRIFLVGSAAIFMIMAGSVAYLEMPLAAPPESEVLAAPALSPSVTTPDVPTIIAFTTVIENPDTKGVKLQFFDPMRNKWKTIGKLRDDGLSGDGAPKDRNLGIRLQVVETAGSTELAIVKRKGIKIKGRVMAPAQVRLVARQKGTAGRLVSPAVAIPSAPPESEALVPPVAQPDVIARDVPTVVTFTSGISDAAIKSLKLQFFDPSKGKWKTAGKLRDNGKYGDLVSGDKTYSMELQLTESSGTTQVGRLGGPKLRVKANIVTPAQFRLRARKQGQRGLLVSPPIRIRTLNVTVPVEVSSAGGTAGDPATVSFGDYGTLVDVPVSVPGGEVPSSAFLVFVMPNDGQLTLQDWFAQNVDLEGTLAAAGTYTQRDFPDARSALVSVGPRPANYYGPPLPYAYLISSSRRSVAAVQLSSENLLSSLGYDTPEAQNALLDTFIETLVVGD